MHDLSENGVFLRTQRPLRPATPLQIEFQDRAGARSSSRAAWSGCAPRARGTAPPAWASPSTRSPTGTAPCSRARRSGARSALAVDANGVERDAASRMRLRVRLAAGLGRDPSASVARLVSAPSTEGAMASERTLAIVKPDAVAKGATGEILRRIEAKGLRIIGLKKLQLSEQLARGFYAVHKERPFYKDLVAFMSSGPVVVAALEGENAVAIWRELMGPTDSTKAAGRHRAPRLRHRHRAQRRARLRRHGHGPARDRLLLRRRRDPRAGRGALRPGSDVGAAQQQQQEQVGQSEPEPLAPQRARHERLLHASRLPFRTGPPGA